MAADSKKRKVFAAMSGGVDSSVAAALLQKAGFRVVGVFMKQWSAGENDLDCLWKEEREHALRAAAALDIPLLTWDFSKEYKKYVAEYMVKGYEEGITPNPDVMCNKVIKFGLFLDRALELGADYTATGHYVRLKTQTPRENNSVQYKLLKAKDSNKDQSYFLYTLTQEKLKYCLFPIGDYTKEEVRKMAKKFGLPNWAKPDSQGVCFVGPLSVRDFLKSRIKPKRGLVIDKTSGKILGEHDGVWFYTIGQRHGMGLSAGKPQYVAGKDVKNNILYVSDGLEIQNSKIKNQNDKSKSKSLQIKDFNWISRKRNLPLDCKVKIRYRQKDLDCTIVKNGGAIAEVNIKAENLPAPGQAAVFYKGNEVLGGGTIA